MAVGSERNTARQRRASGTARWTLLGAGAATVVSSLALIAGMEDRWSAAAVLIGLAVASFMIGSLAGFLMGMPRYVAARESDNESTRYEPSTSLEQISDWLTKVLIGIGIAEATSVARAVNGLLNDEIVPALATAPGAYPVALATLITALVGGFYLAWLLTRLTLAGALRDADSDVLTEAAANVEDPDLRDRLLDLAETSIPSAIEDSRANESRAYEDAVLRVLQEAAPPNTEVKLAIKPWDALVVRGDRRIAVEAKHVTAEAVFLSTVRNQVGRLLTGARNRRPDAVLLVSNQPLSKAAEREIPKLAERGYSVVSLHWKESDGVEPMRDALAMLFP